MKELIYSTRSDLTGPWLLDEAALTSFDSVLDKEAEHLRAIRDAKLMDAVEHELKEAQE
jgi:hypothetical protein